MEFVAIAAIVLLLVIAGCAAVFSIPETLPTPGWRPLRHGQPDGWQLMRIAAALIMICSIPIAFYSHSQSVGFFVVTLAVAVSFSWLIRTWKREILLLMSLRDDEMPGRHDKLIWFAVLFLFAPIGFWLFRSYRAIHWPHLESGAEPAMAKGPSMVPDF